MPFKPASRALKLLGVLISMVGTSVTSAPSSRNGRASPPDCLLARVVRMRQPISGLFASLFMAHVPQFKADWEQPPRGGKPLQESYRRPAATASAPSACLTPRDRCPGLSGAISGYRQDVLPWRAG